MNCSVYILTPALEREHGLRYILNVMGCKGLTYWLGTFLFDYLAYMLTIALLILFFFILGVEFMYPFLGRITCIMALYGIALITFTYMFSFAFKKSNTAFKTFPLVTFFVFYTLPGILLTISEFVVKSHKLFTTIEVIFVTISPFYAL